jgi:NADPH:quinone reductase-like Zn-dependent oxidoreductase
MRAIVFDRYGDPDVMRLRKVSVPEPQEGEVLIRPRCTSSTLPASTAWRWRRESRAQSITRPPKKECLSGTSLRPSVEA